MKKFEYSYFPRYENTSNEEWGAKLNAYGGEGWELVSVVGHTPEELEHAYFKREIKSYSKKDFE